jgi:hypothetical protein
LFAVFVVAWVQRCGFSLSALHIRRIAISFKAKTKKNNKKMGEMPLRVIYGTPVVL